VDYTTGTPTVTVTCDADPAKNNWNLGAGSDAPPAGTASEGYGTEVRWNLNDLYKSGVLKAGHNYRFYVMVHDGDQNKSGGDSGQAAYNYAYPGPTTQGISISGTVFVDADRSGVMDNGETGLSGILITLTGTDLNGNAVNLTTTTGDDGTYSFRDLLPGTYSLTQSLPTFLQGEVASPGTVGGSTGGAAQGTTTIAGISLNPGDIGINYNFADVARAG